MSESKKAKDGSPTFALAIAYNELIALLVNKGLLTVSEINGRLDEGVAWLKSREEFETAEFVEALKLKTKSITEDESHGG